MKIDIELCEVTGNICGTDTITDGCPCMCKNCQKWLIQNQIDCPEEFIRVVDEHFWELI